MCYVECQMVYQDIRVVGVVRRVFIHRVFIHSVAGGVDASDGVGDAYHMRGLGRLSNSTHKARTHIKGTQQGYTHARTAHTHRAHTSLLAHTAHTYRQSTHARLCARTYRQTHADTSSSHRYRFSTASCLLRGQRRGGVTRTPRTVAATTRADYLELQPGLCMCDEDGGDDRCCVCDPHPPPHTHKHPPY